MPGHQQEPQFERIQLSGGGARAVLVAGLMAAIIAMIAIAALKTQI